MVFAPILFIVVVLNWVMLLTPLGFFNLFIFYVYGFFITMYVSVDFFTWCPWNKKWVSVPGNGYRAL